jgi:type IV pilus assembly protein PilM
VRKVDEAIEFEIENHVPFAIDEMVIDYHVSQSTKESSKVLVVYARKGLFVKYLTMLNNINLDPRYICMEGVELANLTVLGMSPPDTSFALVDIGHSKTTVTVCRGKKLIYTRTIGIAGQLFTEAIQQKLNVPADEAERFKI